MRNAARIIAVIYTALITVFALLSGAGSGAKGILENLPNAAPWLLAWVGVLIAWYDQKTGGWLFIALAAASVFFFNTYRELAPFLVVTLPLAVIGILFLKAPAETSRIFRD